MIWAQLDEPDMSTLIASSTSPLTEDILKAIQAVMSGDDPDSWFTWLYGNWRQGSREWRSNYFVHGARRAKNISEPSFDTTSVDVGMTGYHHRIHHWDDPIHKNKLRDGRDAYMRAVHDAVNASYNALQSNGLLMFTLTRYLDDDVAGRHFREEGIATWTGMTCPNSSIFEKIPMGEGNWHVFFWQTEDELTGKPTHPILMDEKKIADAKRRDPEDFACQQQNNPGTGERAVLTEQQIPGLFVDYKDAQFEIPIEAASIHIDTAFKTLKKVRTGDDCAIVVWLHDARRNGMVYLDTDNLLASNELREEQFNTQLINRFINLRRRMIPVKKLTDEVEPGGKAETYKNRLLSILYSAGLPMSGSNFMQLNRTTDKKARIRSALGYWAEGYVKIFLHKDIKGEWIIPPVLRKFIAQITRIDVVQHDDLADAATDVFVPGIWIRPQRIQAYSEEGENPWAPGDDNLKSFSRPISNEELFRMMDAENKEIQNTLGPGHGWDYELNYDIDYVHSPIK
jgi:hypothetical protein